MDIDNTMKYLKYEIVSSVCVYAYLCTYCNFLFQISIANPPPPLPGGGQWGELLLCDFHFT